MSDLVTMASYDDPVKAALARNLLQNEGIEAILLDESSVSTDWLLSNAIGGIKLQVALQHVERAELLLQQITCHDEDDLDRDEAKEDGVKEDASTAFAALTPEQRRRNEEMEADRRAEEIDRAPCNQLVDRLFRTTVLGLLFLPVQVYALWLLIKAFGVRREVSPERRWKIWVSLLLNVPVMGFLLWIMAWLMSV